MYAIRSYYVEEMLSDNLNKVVTSSNDGKTENCNASFIYIVVSRIISDNPMLIISIKSSKKVGSGIIINNIIIIINNDTALLKNFFIPSSCIKTYI